MDVRDTDAALHISVRLEGLKKFKASAEDNAQEVEFEVATAVSINCGLTAWADEPYRGEAVVSFPFTFGQPRPLDLDDEVDERKFSDLEQLSLWLEAKIKSYTALGFSIVHYKANGLPLDWLQGINLP